MKRVHFMGIGGVGMAGVAFLLKKAGVAVTGCDKFATPRTRWLEANGIPVALGHDPAHLAAADELVVTPAVPPAEPERAAAQERGLAVRFRGEVLAALVNAADGVAVCGSHGKTTTATFTAKLLAALGDDPSWCIGGETGAFPVAGCGKGPFVVEADESDGTLALYRARTLVVTNVDYDHPEHFKTEAAYRAVYAEAERHAADVVHAWELDASDFPELRDLVVGAHNVANARAAIEVALRRGHDRAAIRAALPHVLSALPDRRFQTVAPGVCTDYAHHPAEIACALAMARAKNPKRLRVLFQPHRYSRTAALLERFPPALADCDELVLLPTYAAFEKPIPGGDVADLYAACRRHFATCPRAPALRLARTVREGWRHVARTWTEGDFAVLLGAGDLIALVPEIENPPPVETKRIFIGAGSNTWRSDLSTDEEYVRTDGPANAPGASLGIPWMAGIPGTIGGWTKMNAGAFGHSFSEVVESVVVRHADGSFETIPAAQCGFGYRTSAIPDEIYAVNLVARDAGETLGVSEPRATSHEPRTTNDYLARRKKFPAGTWGSVFKNPPGDFAGRLLEEAGAKELAVGGAYVWREHANVIVRSEGATASDALALARLMARAVYFKFGVMLEPEVRGLAV